MDDKLTAAHDIFAGIEGADAFDQFEANGNPGAMMPFEGTIDRNAATTLVNPRELVTCYVRPGRQYSMVVDPMALVTARAQGYQIDHKDPVRPVAHFIPGKAYRLSQKTFAANRAVLCTAPELSILLAQQRSLSHQDVTKQVQAMRAERVQTSRQMMTPEQLSKEQQMRARYVEEDGAAAAAEQFQQRVIAEKKQEEATAADVARDSILGALTAEQLDAHCAGLMAQADAVSAGFGQRGREQVMLATKEEVDGLRLRWSQLHPVARDAEVRKVPADLATRAAKLRSLLDAGAITQPEFDRQLTQLVNE